MSEGIGDKAYDVPPVIRAFKLLRHIAAGETCENVSATAKLLKINRTTLFRLLHTLEAEGMIEQTENGSGWQLGIGMFVLAANAMQSRDIVQLARPVMKRLASAHLLSAHLGILDGQEIIYLAREAPNSHLVSNIREGTRLPAHATSVGRILLSFLPEKDLAALYPETELPALTPKTPTNLIDLQRQIADDRKCGFAWSEGNFEVGIGSCAVPIFDNTGQVVAGLNLTGPEAKFMGDETSRAEIVTTMIGGAAEISAALGYRNG